METSAHGRIAESDREQLERTLRLVEQLGGKAVTLSGENTAEEILAFARSRNVTKILLGKPPRAPWLSLFRPGFMDSVIRNSEGIDVYIIGATPRNGSRGSVGAGAGPAGPRAPGALISMAWPWWAYRASCPRCSIPLWSP